MGGPLDGLVVLEVGWGAPGAIAGLLFADYGARVVKVERPGGPPAQPPVLRSAWDRGKWSAIVDLDTGAGRGDLITAVRGADVLIESFGPGRAAALGFDDAALRAENPGLVVCSLSGYGPDGPWRDRPGYDCLVAARLGLMAEQPGHRDGPVFLGHPNVVYGTALLATIGSLAALRARDVTGEGQVVDVSLLDGAVAQSCMNWWWNEGGKSYLARSGTQKGFGSNRLIADLFRCGDGEYLMMHSGGEGGFKRTMDLLGLGDRVRTIPGLEMAVPLDDDERHAARRLAPKAFESRPRDEWLKLFHDADIAALPVLRPGEVLDDEQLDHAGVVVEIPDPVLGRLRQAGPGVRFEGSPSGTPQAAPAVGEHTDRLGELAARPAPSGTGALRHALEGVRILDLSSFFAAAYGAKLLSDLGADVIKVETPGGDQMRPMPDPFEACQRGKRALSVDLRTPAGREVLYQLVATADVVVHNLRPGKAERLGVGYADLAAHRADLVYCYLPGFGSTGPKSQLKSFAPLISGFAGLLSEGGGAGNPPARRVLGNEDYYNGFLSAAAVLMALHHRDGTGEGQYLECPQLHSGLFATSHECQGPDGTVVPGLVLDRDQTGWGPLYRLYRTADGWICIAVVGEAAFTRMCAALDAEQVSTMAGDELAAALTDVFAALSTDDAFARLDGAGVPCEVPLDSPFMPDLLWEEWAVESGRVFEHHHPTLGWIREFGHTIHLSATPGPNRGPGPLHGQHNEEILAELGYSPERIGELLESVCRSLPVSR